MAYFIVLVFSLQVEKYGSYVQILFFVYLYINAILTHDMFYNCGIVVNVEVILG